MALQGLRTAAQDLAAGRSPTDVVGEAVGRAAQGMGIDPSDFLTAREQGASTGTRIVARKSSLSNAGEALNRSGFEAGPNGPVHVITPMVMPQGPRVRAMLPVVALGLLPVIAVLPLLPFDGLPSAVFGPHFWVLWVVYAAFRWWRAGMVMVPDGCQALITKFGKVEQQVGPGRVTLLNPWKRVSYIVNTVREYPFNAPIHEAPTKSGVKASVDLFLQFRIADPREFIFVLGAVQGFQDKLNNAISETTRSLIYEQEASGIYDLVGESTARLLEQLNAQFRPAVELTNANITHAEPSSQEYRMDLASPEIVRVAKEAYTYEYELQLKKEQNEGDLNKDLASLNETLSSIQADIAQYQAQMDTALERETNRARAMARQRYVEAESTANANAALLEAQALDIRAMSAAEAPEILDYRFQQDLLTRLESLAGSMPQVVQVGDQTGAVDFLAVAQQIIGSRDGTLFTSEDMELIRNRKDAIATRVSEREAEIAEVLDTADRAPVSSPAAEFATRAPTYDVAPAEEEGAPLPPEEPAAPQPPADDALSSDGWVSADDPADQPADSTGDR